MKWKKPKLSIIIGLCLSVLVVASLAITIPLARNYPYRWQTADPEDYGFDAAKLEVTHSIAENMPFLRSLLIVRHGKLVVEWYFNDGAMDTSFHIHSASKTFISALMGIAIDKGIIESLDLKLMDFLPEYQSLSLDPRIYDITLDHLIKMRAGFNFNDSPDDWIPYGESPDRTRYTLELPLLHNPDEDWHYGTPQTHLLSIILTRAANMSTREFADKYLFEPLRITVDLWPQDPQGYYTGGHAMNFTSRELARFGLLYLNNGSFNNKQIIPKQWVLDSIQDYAEGRVDEGMRSSIYEETGYGYQIWIEEYCGYLTYSARGHGGQFILWIPELDLVLILTASGTIFETYPYQYTRIAELLEHNVLASVIPDN